MTTYTSVILVTTLAAAMEVRDVRHLYGDIVLWGIVAAGLLIIISAEMRNPNTKVTFWYVAFSVGASFLFAFLSIGFYLSSMDVEKWMLYILIAASLLFGKEVADLLMKKAPAAIGNGIIEVIKNALSGTLTFLTNKKNNDGNNDL